MKRGSGKPGGDIGKRPGHRAPPGYDGSKYPKPSVACDAVILRFVRGRLEVLLIERAHDPYAGYWAFPGGYVDLDEDLPVAAAREVWEETGLRGLDLIELGAFGDPARDPRGRVISIAYLALVRGRGLKPRAGDDARNAQWHPVTDLPELAFDHALVMIRARARLGELTVISPAAFNLLPAAFTETEILQLFSEIFGRTPDPARFKKWLRDTPSIQPALRSGPGGPRYRLVRRGFHPRDYLFGWPDPITVPARPKRRPL